MAFEFKRLSDVEIVNTASDDTTVLIEEDGDIKRINKNKLGGGTVKSVNGVKPDAEGNIEIAAGDVTSNSVIINSSTEGSTKRFRITVTDDGQLSAVEVD